MDSFACIVLAAGKSARFGRDKRQIRNAEGKTLLEMTLSSIPAIFQQRILVLHPGDETLGKIYENDWQVIYAELATQGMGHSIASAITLVTDGIAALIALADMPLVLPETYRLLQQAAQIDHIVVPFFEQQRGNPVMIGRQFFSTLAKLEGDSGARQLMQQHPELMVRLNVSDPGILRDADTPEALVEIPGFHALI
ncbi:MAG: nucleotidyltransferase family protein [Pseudomonadota bacterium]